VGKLNIFKAFFPIFIVDYLLPYSLDALAITGFFVRAKIIYT